MKNKRHSFKKIDFRKKEKEPLEPLFKKQALITALSVLLVVLITLTGSFAVFTKTSEGNEYNVVQVGELELSYVDLNDEGNVLGLADNYPISDTDGETSTPYRFSVENTGTIIADYTVKIVDDTDTIEADGCSDNLLDNSYIRYKFDNETSQNLIDKKDATTNEYVIYSGTLEPFESNIHEIRLWINENSPNSILGTHYHGKVVIEVTQNNATDPYERPVAPSKIFDTIASDLIYAGCETYDDGVDTFLVGKCKYNYVWYSGKLWRVVLKNNETGAVKMITDNGMTSIPYNEYGNVNFDNSFIEQWLQQEFLPTLHDYNNYLVVDSNWDVTINSSYTPSRPTGDSTITRTVGLLNSYERYTVYNKLAESVSSNEVYLNKWLKEWLMTPYNESNIICSDEFGFAKELVGKGYSVRPAIYLKGSIGKSGGSGSQTNPYILENDLKSYVNGETLISTRYSGEYVSFNDRLYRIVGVENGLTKITEVNLGTFGRQSFDSTITNFAEAAIYTTLETYYQNLASSNSLAYNMIQPSTEWYTGTINFGVNYKKGVCETFDNNLSMNMCTSKVTPVISNIGLPRVGEMFTSQITRSSPVDISFWTLTQNSRGVYSISANDLLPEDGSTYQRSGVRPSLYLKSNVVIASDNTGNGTYEKPYKIELGQ